MSQTQQPVGPPVDWSPATPPRRAPIDGRYTSLEPLDPERHADALWRSQANDPELWTYSSSGPFTDLTSFRTWLSACAEPQDPLCFAIVDRVDGEAKGMASYLRVVPEHGVIEVGAIWFGAPLQRTRQATEAIYLMAREAFEALGYRRLEWKCDSLNAPSRRAAVRFGFDYEGLFRQAIVYKGRNRDTAWYAMLDADWPALRAAFDAWLTPENFDPDGTQRTPLATPRETAT